MTSDRVHAAGCAGGQRVPGLDVSQGTVFSVKRRFAESGLDGVLKDWPSVGFAS